MYCDAISFIIPRDSRNSMACTVCKIKYEGNTNHCISMKAYVTPHKRAGRALPGWNTPG